jgi:catechol 2,3-dioxygenase-like lactoylglutathione lyase family enzyme
MALDSPILFAATTDGKRSRAFYENVLGLQFVSEDQFAIVFQVGPVPLRIQKVMTKPELGYTVLGWTIRDIDKEIRRLSEAGVRFNRYEGLDQNRDGIWCSPSGAKIAWFADPDGNTLSLTQHA